MTQDLASLWAPLSLFPPLTNQPGELVCPLPPEYPIFFGLKKKLRSRGGEEREKDKSGMEKKMKIDFS